MQVIFTIYNLQKQWMVAVHSHSIKQTAPFLDMNTYLLSWMQTANTFGLDPHDPRIANEAIKIRPMASGPNHIF